MPFYQDPQYNVGVQTYPIYKQAIGTSTASGANTFATAITPLPKFINKTKLNQVRVTTVTAPVAGVTASILAVLNGTDTAALATIAAAGTGVNVTLTDSLSTFTAGAGPTVTYLGTATASALALGTYNIDFYQTELFS